MKWLTGDRPPRTDERVVFLLGCIVVIGSGVLSMTVIVGCFLVMLQKVQIDQGLLAVCTGIIGSVLAGAGVSAQQVIASYFSRKSEPKPNLPERTLPNAISGREIETGRSPNDAGTVGNQQKL
jgi:hypothetical protein